MHYATELWWTLGRWSELFFSSFFFSSFIVYVIATYLAVKSLKKNKKFQFLAVAISILLLVPYSFLALFTGIFLFDNSNPQASRFFKIHAAVVNTCLLDPNKLHCPQKLEDIRVVEEQEFDKVTECCQVSYLYRPEDATYRLVIRYSPVRVVIFDPSFIPYNQHNFIETSVNILGKPDAATFFDPREGKEVRLTFDEWNYSKESK